MEMQPEWVRSAPENTGSSEIDLWRYVDAIWRRRWMVIAAVVVALVYSFWLQTQEQPVFTSRARILVEPPVPELLDLDQLFQTGRGNRASETHIQLLTSRGFIQRVIESEGLLRRLGGPAESAETAGLSPLPAGATIRQRVRHYAKSGLATLRGAGTAIVDLLAPEKGQRLDEEILPAELRDRRYTRALRQFQRQLGVRTIEGTKLIDVSWTDQDPVFATKMANTIATEFRDFNLETRAALSNQAAGFLTAEIGRLRSEIRAGEAELDALAEELGLIETGGAGVSASAAALASELAGARARRIALESEVARLREARPSEVAAVQSDPAVRRARDRLADLESTRAELSGRLTDAHPRMQELQADIADQRGRLEQLERAALDATMSERRTALESAAATERRLAGLSTGATGSGGIREDQYEELEQFRTLQLSLEGRREMLNNFSEQQSSLELSSRIQGFQGASIQVVDPAVLPEEPSNKTWFRSLLIAGAFGFLIGAGLALGLDYMDNTLRSSEDVTRRLSVPTLGSISAVNVKGPKVKDEKYHKPLVGHITPEFVVWEQPKSRNAEEYRELRTSLLLSCAGGPPKTVLVTSATPSEGKTTTAANLAYSMAHAGKRTLLIDGDMRRPRLGKILGVNSEEGLSNYLAGSLELEAVIQSSAATNLWVLTSGPSPPNPAELFQSERLQEVLQVAAAHFDVVIVDAPPALTVVDPLILAPMVEGVVVVAKAGQTPHQLVGKTIARITNVRGRVLGVVLNSTRRESGLGYGYGYGRRYGYGYGYGYGSSSSASAPRGSTPGVGPGPSRTGHNT